MSDPWPIVLIVGVPFAVSYLWLGLLLWRRPSCPECGTRAPVLVSPFAKTKRQWVEGGWTCGTCGIDVDTHGRMVAPGTGPRPGWMIRNTLLIVPPTVVAALLLYLSIMLIQQEPEPRLAPESPPAVPAADPVPPVGNWLQ